MEECQNPAASQPLTIISVSKKNCSVFHLVQVELKTRIFNFLANFSTNLRLFCRLWSKILIHFPPFQGRVEHKKCCGSLSLLYIYKVFYKICTCALQEICDETGGGVPNNLVLLSRIISSTIQPIFFILSPCVWKN